MALLNTLLTNTMFAKFLSRKFLAGCALFCLFNDYQTVGVRLTEDAHVRLIDRTQIEINQSTDHLEARLQEYDKTNLLKTSRPRKIETN